MKKIISSIIALTLLIVMASCGEEKIPSDSSSAPTSTPVIVSSEVSSTPIIVPSIIIEPEVDSKNLALKGTLVDMNTGKKSTDEGYIAYYDDIDNTAYAIDGVNNVPGDGWQVKAATIQMGAFDADSINDDHPFGTYTDANTNEHLDLDDTMYVSGGDGNVYKKQTYAYGALWVGVLWEETTKIDTVVIYSEHDADFGETYGVDFKLEITTDGETWTEITEGYSCDRVTPEDNSITTCTTITITEAIDVQGVRIVILNGTSKYGPKICELEVYAPEETEG